MAKVVQIARDSLPLFWPHVVRLLRKDHAPFDPHRLHHLIQLGERTLWVAGTTHPEAAFTTGLVINPSGTSTLVVHLMAGCGIEGWIDLALERVATLVRLTPAIDHVQVDVRKGWLQHALCFQSLTAQGVSVTFGRDRPTRRGKPHRNRVSPEIGALVCLPRMTAI
jgi:hypothetical protein